MVVRGAAPTIVRDLAHELVVHLGLLLESSVENAREERGQLRIVGAGGFPHGLVGLALDRTLGIAIDGDDGMLAGGGDGAFGGGSRDILGLGRIGLRSRGFRRSLFGQLRFGRSRRSGGGRRTLFADTGIGGARSGRRHLLQIQGRCDGFRIRGVETPELVGVLGLQGLPHGHDEVLRGHAEVTGGDLLVRGECAADSDHRRECHCDQLVHQTSPGLWKERKSRKL